MLSSPALRLLSAGLCLIASRMVVAFAPQPSTFLARPSTTPVFRDGDVATFDPSHSPSRTALSMAGFGASSTKKKKGKLPKLKAKTQWDRYKEFKSCAKITVGVRVTGEEDWMEVGRVRAAEDESVEAAVAVQRALIAEHAKRLFPVQLPPNAALEWGYVTSDEGEEETTWAALDKSKGDDAPKGIEKKIGFEGISDKASGFYCYYHEGRIVEKEEEGMGTRGAGFKAVKGK